MRVMIESVENEPRTGSVPSMARVTLRVPPESMAELDALLRGPAVMAMDFELTYTGGRRPMWAHEPTPETHEWKAGAGLQERRTPPLSMLLHTSMHITEAWLQKNIQESLTECLDGVRPRALDWGTDPFASQEGDRPVAPRPEDPPPDGDAIMKATAVMVGGTRRTVWDR
jgi:hypothetical protein